MRNVFILTCAALMLGSTGCAKVLVRKIDHDDSTPGVRFYRSAPYLLVTVEPVATAGSKADADAEKKKLMAAAPEADPKPGPTFKTAIIWLPETDEEYVIETKSGWGTADASVELQDGWNLKSLGAKMDSKGPETITAVGGLITALGGVGLFNAGPGPDRPLVAPGLYRILFGPDGTVSGVKRIDLKIE